jgi:hypothetical protein
MVGKLRLRGGEAKVALALLSGVNTEKPSI